MKYLEVTCLGCPSQGSDFLIRGSSEETVSVPAKPVTGTGFSGWLYLETGWEPLANWSQKGGLRCHRCTRPTTRSHCQAKGSQEHLPAPWRGWVNLQLAEARFLCLITADSFSR